MKFWGLHKLLGKQWNLSKFGGGRGKRMALSTLCLRPTNGLLLLLLPLVDPPYFEQFFPSLLGQFSTNFEQLFQGKVQKNRKKTKQMLVCTLYVVPRGCHVYYIELCKLKKALQY